MDYHVLTGTDDGNSFRIVNHIPIPSAVNRVNVNYRTAIINSGLGGRTVLPDGDGTGGTISAAEKAAILAGSLYEHVEDFATNPGETAAQLQARLDARYDALVGIVQDRAAKMLSYYGFARNTP
jgi:hypothetical protein